MSNYMWKVYHDKLYVETLCVKLYVGKLYVKLHVEKIYVKLYVNMSISVILQGGVDS